MKTLRIRDLALVCLVLAGLGSAPHAVAQDVDYTFVPYGPTFGSAVNFSPIPGGGFQCDWDWGDGSPMTIDNTCIQEQHFYADLGIYAVTLSVPGFGAMTKEVGVLEPTNAQNFITPKFHASTMTPTVGQEVSFVDQTTPQASVGHWLWDFGDGQISYFSQPTHVWDSPGDKVVKLTVQNQFTQQFGRSFTTAIHVTGGTVLPSATPTAPLLTGTPTRTPTPIAGQQVLVGYIPVVGSTPGNFGSFFRTSVQLLNPGASASAGRLVFHPAGVIGAPTNPSLSWSLAPGQTIAYDDVVAAMSQTGLGSMDVYVAEGTPVPVVLTRVFDDAGAAGTSGFTEPFYRTSEVPSNGSGFLIGPSDTARFRYNIGVRTLDTDVTVTATVRNSAGVVVHSVVNSYPRNTFLQTSAASFLGFSLGNNQSIQIAFTGGGLIAYGATVDNVTNDPSAQFLSYGAATQTADAGLGGRRSSTPLLFATVLAVLAAAVSAVVAKR